MKRVIIGVFVFALPFCAAAQSRDRRYSPPANSLPPRPPGAITDTGFASALGRSIQGYPMAPIRGGAVTPYLLMPPAYPPPPVFYYMPPPGPAVVLNQTFVAPAAAREAPPEDPPAPTFSGYRAPLTPSVTAEPPAEPPAAPATVLKPSLYLIALKDGSVLLAMAYWYEDGALNYVGKNHEIHVLSLDHVDRELSSRLNRERGIDFHFPE
ncbi:MAG TPA: hypothetical protein VHD76_00150 [Bryobacteraceae bacterium]|jgi:hypothetical protein|nr:hypothetical protein [Bryobacteraceae bacterium]